MVLLRSRSSCLLRSTICVAHMQSVIFILNAIYSASPTVWFRLSESQPRNQNRNHKTQVLKSSFFLQSNNVYLVNAALFSTFFQPKVLMLHPVSPVQGLQFCCNLYATLHIPPSYLLKPWYFFHFIAVTWILHCPDPKCHLRLYPKTLFCSLFIRRLLFFFLLVCLQKANVYCTVLSQHKKNKIEHTFFRLPFY